MRNLKLITPNGSERPEPINPENFQLHRQCLLAGPSNMTGHTQMATKLFFLA